MADQVKNVLFLCTGNSARGLLAEALLEIRGKGRFKAYSAGIHPGALINPFAAELIQQLGYPVGTMRCKRWSEFAVEDAVQLDYVITLCGNTSLMAHPVWPGNPVIVKWDIEDPTATLGTIEDKRAVFRRAYEQLDARIGLFIDIANSGFEQNTIQQKLNQVELVCRDRLSAAD
jgi:arsenate reductase